MNLNRYKKGFTSTNPERGLRSLPGASRPERHAGSPGTIRVKGRYISQDTDKTGRVFGMMGFITSWLYVILLPWSLLAEINIGSVMFTPLSIFIIGFAVVHGCALFADGLRNSDAPWATKGIKIFWSLTLLVIVYAVIASLMAG